MVPSTSHPTYGLWRRGRWVCEEVELRVTNGSVGNKQWLPLTLPSALHCVFVHWRELLREEGQYTVLAKVEVWRLWFVCSACEECRGMRPSSYLEFSPPSKWTRILMGVRLACTLFRTWSLIFPVFRPNVWNIFSDKISSQFQVVNANRISWHWLIFLMYLFMKFVSLKPSSPMSPGHCYSL